MKKNILEVCLSPDLGGLELFTVHCYNTFKENGICKVALDSEKKLDIYLDCDDKIYLKRNKLFPFIPAYKLAKEIDKYKIDIIHFHWTRDVITVVLAKLLSKQRPKIIQSRHMRMTRFKDDIYHRWLYENIDTIHAVTNQVKEQLEKFIPVDIRPKIKMAYLGVSQAKIDETKIIELKKKYNIHDEFIIGIIGRIEEGKGQYLLIEAIKKLENLNIKVLIVGDSMDKNYKEQMTEKVNDFGLNNKIVFTGFTKDVNEHIKLCDVTILATANETFGLVVIESMVNGVPVIATNNGGPLEIIDDLEDGLLFDRTVDDLVEKIEAIYTNKNLKNELSINGYKKVQDKFNKEKQMKKMYEILNES